MELKARELTEDGFSSYGYFIDNRSQEPLEKNERFTFWGKLKIFAMGPDISAGIVEGHKVENFKVETVEKHSNTSELLTGLNKDSVVLVGCLEPEQKVIDYTPFIIREGQTIVLKPGIWHSPPLPLEKNCRLLVLYNEGTAGNDVEEKQLSEYFINVT